MTGPRFDRIGTEPARATWPGGTSGMHRRFEKTVRIGSGDDTWDRVRHDVLRWRVKTRSGFRVDSATDAPVEEGERLIIRARVLGMTVREPVGVVEVVRLPDRVGFSYRTLPGHPVDGEEAFIVHRHGEDVLFSIRSLTAPAPAGIWRALHPLLRLAQRVARRRYLRALR